MKQPWTTLDNLEKSDFIQAKQKLENTGDSCIMTR